MRERYLNAVYTNLILDRDYQPAPGTGPAREKLALQKYRNGIFFLVELIDGDGLSAPEIGEKLATAHRLLLEQDYEQILHVIAVLVFENAPAPDKLAAITNGLREPKLVKRYLSCFTVDLAGRAVVRRSKSFLDADGVEKILQAMAKQSNAAYDGPPDVDSLLALRAREYSIAVKAQKPVLTYMLIAVNTAVWVVLNIYALTHRLDFDSQVNLLFGAKVNSLIMAGQYWRLITPVFLHAGTFPVHLFVNCYSLYILGNLIEKIFGHAKYAWIYFLAGLFGNIASFIFIPYAAGVGASGAIFGLFGALLYYGLEEPKIFRKYFGSGVIATIIINILLTLSIPGIDYTAHLGGLLGGFLTAYALKVKELPGRTGERALLLAGVLLIAAAGIWLGFRMPWNLELVQR